MMNYFADSSEEKYFRCAQCGASLIDGEHVISSPGGSSIKGCHTLPDYDFDEDEISNISYSCEIICTTCGQHLGVVEVEEEADNLVPLWI